MNLNPKELLIQIFRPHLGSRGLGQLNIWDQVLQNSADVLHKRDPQNAFFRWLSEGTSDGLADLIISQVPKDGNHTLHQWSFVREDSEKAWEQSMGWDYIFLIDHLLKAPVVV